MSLFTKKNRGDDDSVHLSRDDESSSLSSVPKINDLKNKSSSQASVGRYDTRATINYRAYWVNDDDNDGYIIR